MTFAILYGADPWQRTDGGSVRVQALHRALENLGVRTLFPPGSGALLRPGSTAKALKQRYLPLPTRHGDVIRSMRTQLEEMSPQAVVCASHALTPAALGYPKSDVWIDHFDLWSDFGRREAEQRRGLPRATTRAQAALWSWREKHERQRCTIATAASFEDAGKMRDTVWLPTPVPLLAQQLMRPTGRVAGFLANFAFWPNRDAYEHLIEAWLPRLRTQGWTVLVAGYEAESLTPHPQVINIGQLPRTSDFYEQVDICLAPLRLGGGMKVKVVEALAHGRPVLGTPHATDGLPGSVAAHVVVCELPPADLSAQMEALDYRVSLSDSLDAYSPASFDRSTKALAQHLLEARG